MMQKLRFKILYTKTLSPEMIRNRICSLIQVTVISSLDMYLNSKRHQNAGVGVACHSIETWCYLLFKKIPRQ